MMKMQVIKGEQMMEGKKVLLCVTGGIAAFKAATVTSQLKQLGFDVRVIMTESAQKFITPLTFQTLSRNPVYFDTFDEKDPSGVAHIDLADWADIVVVTPATANMIGKLANGIADDMVSTTIIATTAPVFIAPAMNVHMYEHPAVVANMNRLKSFAYSFIEPGEGLLACGYVGKGRLAEPDRIIEVIVNHFKTEEYKPLLHKKVLISAGPTREYVDPVRYFTNRSSGKMGYALAEAAKRSGAEVTLVSGPTTLNFPTDIEVVKVESAEEMYKEITSRYQSADIVIKSAAVADYRPKTVHKHKLKKQPGEFKVEMERTKDILLELGSQKKHQYLVGFAAETNDVEKYARQKLERKNLDLVVANNILNEQAGFEVDTNLVTIYKASGEEIALPLASKRAVAESILTEIVIEIQRKNES
jgi:phosphopantothenoylcysteine decarboxylase/phosphopantothenate--cysteine ligase